MTDSTAITPFGGLHGSGNDKTQFERIVELQRDLAAAKEALRYIVALMDEARPGMDQGAPAEATARKFVEAFKEAQEARQAAEDQLELAAAERSSASEAAAILFGYLGWKSGGLGSAAIETVQRAQRAEALAKEAIAIAILLFDAWEDGTPCFETDGESGMGASIGNAFKLSDDDFTRCVEFLNRVDPRGTAIDAARDGK